MITGNKGEWSEIYALFKVLGDKQLFLGNEDLEKLEHIFYPIIKVLRTERNLDFEYSIIENIVLITGNNQSFKIPIETFQRKANYLLNAIKNNKNTTFEVPEIESFLNEINCSSIKANSTSKTDISIVVHDQRTNQQPTLNFSIKSQLGNPSTLLNAGKTTNFIYRIKGVKFSSDEIKRINTISSRSKIKDRILEIQKAGGKLEFLKNEKIVFSNNLILIDSLLPDILSSILLDFFSSGFSHMKELVNNISAKNPLEFDLKQNHEFYSYKIKRFLTDIALGMMPSRVWDGQYDATGGYLIVKEDGDVLCYHIYNKNQFESYLINNTKLETASSSRHGFGKIYEENGEQFFKLNLQIRFIK